MGPASLMGRRAGFMGYTINMLLASNHLRRKPPNGPHSKNNQKPSSFSSLFLLPPSLPSQTLFYQKNKSKIKIRKKT